MSICTTSSEDKIEDDFVVLTASSVAREVTEEAEHTELCTQHPHSHTHSHRCHQFSIQMDLKPEDQRHQPIKFERNSEIMDDERDVVEVYQQSADTQTSGGDSRHHGTRRVVDFLTRLYNVQDCGDDDDDDDSDSSNKPSSRDSLKPKAVSAGTDLASEQPPAGDEAPNRTVDTAILREESSHSVIASIANYSCANKNQDNSDDESKKRRNNGCQRGRSRCTKVSPDDEEAYLREGSRSLSSAELGQTPDNFCQGQSDARSHDTDSQESKTSLIQIGNISNHQLSLFSDISCEEAWSETCHCDSPAPTGGLTEQADQSELTSISDNATRVTSALSDLVGGLDSQIHALCRNFQLLAGSRDLAGIGQDETDPKTVDEDAEDNDPGEVRDEGRPEEERYYDCISPEQEKILFGDSLTALPNGIVPDRPQNDLQRKLQQSHGSKLVLRSGVPSKNLAAHLTPPFEQVLEKDHHHLTDVHSADASKSCQKGKGTPGSLSEFNHAQRFPMPKFKAVRLNNTRSLPTLFGSKNEESANVIEICTDQVNFSETVSAKMTSRCHEVAPAELATRELSQMFEQSAVLKAMWNNHKRQLRDVLVSREKETMRATRLNQGLARARQVILSLRRQRQNLHQHMEKKEEEFASTLHYHRNETAFLRRKVLAYLEEKKSTMTGTKCDNRLTVILDSLLSLHLYRERFLALDLAKQSKINEMKLLVVRQQLAMDELKERNSDLNHALNTLMQFLPDKGNVSYPNRPRSASSPNQRAATTSWAAAAAAGQKYSGKSLELNDVLHCERSIYLPHHSTSPELAAVAVYGVGGEQSTQIRSPPEEIFDASRQRCHADGDHFIQHTTTNTNGSDTLAEELLRELTLHGPASPNFTLADVD